MTPAEAACVELESFMEKLVEAQGGETDAPADEIDDDTASNDKVQIIKAFE
eukprot:CAMPEP_0185923804 /NCGR_PEP_ID=MMETSP0924C-20121207/11615_1 /TAXON_ID=321610 /ORGANISM="Perkinsus chesapeaki, Strain ATCC PRA-65" /LENGTH=50 /DNA_ID=CAMNT_0028657849 /DNA_START=50 /DNA_END=199 /DNA_ORIENTATION=-